MAAGQTPLPQRGRLRFASGVQHLFDGPPDSGKELLQLQRLLNVANAAHQARTVLITPRLRRSDDRDRNVGEVWILPQFAEHFKAITLGRVQVEENCVRMERVCRCALWPTQRGESFLAVLEPCQLVRDAVLLQRHFDQQYVCRIVFDKHDLSCVHEITQPSVENKNPMRLRLS